MDVYFLRHGEAKEKSPDMDDAGRPLISIGAASISSIGKSLAGIVSGFDAVFTSPLLRARQSADIIGNIFGCKENIHVSKNLLSDKPPSAFIDELNKRKAFERIIVIGHQPNLGACVSFLTGENGAGVDIKKSGCALVTAESLKKGGGKLVWIKSADDFQQ